MDLAGPYAPLNPGFIRLLKFLDPSGTSCSMIVYKLEAAPTYNCLSYAWRDSEDDEDSTTAASIILDGQKKQIQRNLFLALRHVGLLTHERGLPVWIDAICINQDDAEERSAQVRLMKEIYERSHEVIAWIGPASSGSKLAIRLLQIMSCHIDDYNNATFATSNLDWWLECFGKHLTPDDKAIREAWADLIRMLQRRYWSRTWVHQEATVRQTRFYCGSESFTWAELSAFSHFHMTYGGHRGFIGESIEERLQLLGPNNTGSRVLDLLAAYVARQQAVRSNRKDLTRLPTLVRELRMTACSDARDKVYAAVPHALDILPHAQHDLLAVDYTDKTVNEVYTDLARYCVVHGRGLEILGYMCAQSAAQSPYQSRPNTTEHPLPSWFPDWRIVSRIQPLNAIGVLHAAYPTMYHPLRHANNAAPCTQETKLHIKAILFDSIALLTSTTGREILSEAGITPIWKQELDSKCSFTDDAFNRTLVGDATHIEDNGTGLATNVRGGAFDFNLYCTPPAARTKQIREKRWAQFHALRGVTRDRRMGCTVEGRVGIFPEAAELGDRVAAFYGGDALYVIRPCGSGEDEFRFVGECYVDGMMDGQVADFAAESGVSEAWIALV